MTRDYLLHGLAIASDVELAEPVMVTGRGPDLTVSIGEPRRAEDIEGTCILRRSIGNRVVYEAAPRGAGWVVQAPGIASYDITRREAQAHIDPAMSDPGVLSLLLAGTGLAFFLIIHDEFCLHASAVEVDGGCIAFAGSSGRGKTTLAAMACAAGYRLFGDDLLRVRVEDAGTIAYRGSSEIRLRSNAATVAARISGDRRVTVDARTAVRPPRSEHEVLPVRAIVLPRPDREVADVQARRLRVSAAFAGLVECPRLVGWVHPPARDNEFDHLVRLASSVPVIEMRLPWSDELDPGVADAVIRAAQHEIAQGD